jgi:hypothetical protein
MLVFSLLLLLLQQQIPFASCAHPQQLQPGSDKSHVAQQRHLSVTTSSLESSLHALLDDTVRCHSADHCRHRQDQQQCTTTVRGGRRGAHRIPDPSAASAAADGTDRNITPTFDCCDHPTGGLLCHLEKIQNDLERTVEATAASGENNNTAAAAVKSGTKVAYDPTTGSITTSTASNNYDDAVGNDTYSNPNVADTTADAASSAITNNDPLPSPVVDRECFSQFAI